MIEFTMMLDLVSPNRKEHWTKVHARNKKNDWQLRIWWIHNKPKFELPVVVTLIRIAPRKWDYDNLVYSFKGISDTICSLILPGLKPGRADGDGRIKIQYNQESGLPKQKCVRIEIRKMDDNTKF